jgi:energy-converting hydrogenase Eha subunit C
LNKTVITQGVVTVVVRKQPLNKVQNLILTLNLEQTE